MPTLVSAKATFNNFHLSTIATFSKCETPKREPDYVSGSGSAYWYEGDSVVRKSDHWGRGIASCDWSTEEYSGSSWGYDLGEFTGKCELKNFKTIDTSLAAYEGVSKRSLAKKVREGILNNEQVKGKTFTFRQNSLAYKAVRSLLLGSKQEYTAIALRRSTNNFFDEVERILNAAQLSFETGNDAPRGGMTGNFVKLTPSAKRIVKKLSK